MDIVERLRIRIHTSEDETALTNEAADEIERLRGRNAELVDLMQCTVDYTGASVSSQNYTFHVTRRPDPQKESE